MEIPSTIGRFAALVDFLAGVAASTDEEHAAAQDARLEVARAMRRDLEQAIATSYTRELATLDELGPGEEHRQGRELARTRRMMHEASLALVSMRLDSAIIEWSHAYTKAIAYPPGERSS